MMRKMQLFCILVLILQVLIINCGDYNVDMEMPDMDEISSLLRRRMDNVCINIEILDHDDKKARLFAWMIERAVPINEFGLSKQEGLFKLGSRGVVHYMIDQYDYEYKQKGKTDEFEDYCIKFMRSLMKKFGF